MNFGLGLELNFQQWSGPKYSSAIFCTVYLWETSILSINNYKIQIIINSEKC